MTQTSKIKRCLQENLRSFAQIPQQVNVSAKPRGKLTIECDEAWSFVGHKGNKQWICLALDKKTREIVGVYIGERSEDGARGLWNSTHTFLN